MKVFVVFYILIVLLTVQVVSPQEKTLKEGVTVTNIEIPVRVFLKGAIVDNLKKKDFQLFINGKKRKINGFTITRKRLAEQEIELEVKTKKYPPRYFILAMSITNFSPEIKEGVDYVLNKVLRGGDSLLVFINNTTKFFKNIKNRLKIGSELNEYIKKESIKAHVNMVSYFNKIERESYFAKFKLLLRKISRKGGWINEKPIYFIHDFLKNYLGIWKEYKRRYLLPDINNYYKLSEHLNNVKLEKWVISFFQVEMFPEIVITGEMHRIIRAKIYEWQMSEDVEEVIFSRTISRQLSEVQKAMNVSDGFPTEQVTKIFTKVGATFHSVFIPSSLPVFSKDMKYRQISSDLENNLRSLTEKTGGALVASKDLSKAMDEIVKKLDVFYTLTFSPDDDEKLESVLIKTGNKKYDLAYDDSARIAFSNTGVSPDRTIKTPDVEILGLNFVQKKLSFAMSGYIKKKTDDTGAVNVRIRINNAAGQLLFDKDKTLKTTQDKANLSLNFTWLKPGEYEILVDVKDLYTGKTGTDFLKIRVK